MLVLALQRFHKNMPSSFLFPGELIISETAKEKESFKNVFNFHRVEKFSYNKLNSIYWKQWGLNYDVSRISLLFRGSWQPYINVLFYILCFDHSNLSRVSKILLESRILILVICYLFFKFFTHATLFQALVLLEF